MSSTCALGGYKIRAASVPNSGLITCTIHMVLTVKSTTINRAKPIATEFIAAVQTPSREPQSLFLFIRTQRFALSHVAAKTATWYYTGYRPLHKETSSWGALPPLRVQNPQTKRKQRTSTPTPAGRKFQGGRTARDTNTKKNTYTCTTIIHILVSMKQTKQKRPGKLVYLATHKTNKRGIAKTYFLLIRKSKTNLYQILTTAAPNRWTPSPA